MRLRYIWGLLAIFALIGGSAVPSDAFPGANGKIAFVCFDGDEEICTMEPNGANQVNITQDNNHYDSEPAWSADGAQIVYTQAGLPVGAGGGAAIFRMNANGSGQTLVTDSQVTDKNGFWSPSGTRIVFASQNDLDGPSGLDLDLFTVNPDGSDVDQLTSTSGSDESHPAWSPDGTKIAFVREFGKGGSDIYVMNANGTNVQPLTDVGFNDAPAWSPDGTRITFAAIRPEEAQPSGFDADIWSMLADRTDEQRLTTHAAEEVDPTWAPDGTKIAYARPGPGPRARTGSSRTRSGS